MNANNKNVTLLFVYKVIITDMLFVQENEDFFRKICKESYTRSGYINLELTFSNRKSLCNEFNKIEECRELCKYYDIFLYYYSSMRINYENFINLCSSKDNNFSCVELISRIKLSLEDCTMKLDEKIYENKIEEKTICVLKFTTVLSITLLLLQEFLKV